MAKSKEQLATFHGSTRNLKCAIYIDFSGGSITLNYYDLIILLSIALRAGVCVYLISGPEQEVYTQIGQYATLLVHRIYYIAYYDIHRYIDF